MAPCYTQIRVTLDDNDVNRAARKALGLPLDGELAYSDAGRVKVEAGVIRTRSVLQRLAPTAVVKRTGNKLTVTVTT